jgi:hypothetical protein
VSLVFPHNIASSPSDIQQTPMAASAGLHNLPRDLIAIKKRMERDSAEANERLMARLKQRSIALHAAREEELLAQVIGRDDSAQLSA